VDDRATGNKCLAWLVSWRCRQIFGGREGGRGVVGDGRIDGKKRLNGDGRAGAWVLGEDGGAVRGWTPAIAATRLAGRAAAATAVVLTSGGRYG